VHRGPQSVIAKKYRLLDQLGQGGMGQVWRAEHLLLRAEVAVKLMNPELGRSREGLSRFLREAQAAAALRSPHVVQILDYGVDRGTPYFAMELLDGESLRTRLRRVGRLNPKETGALFLQLGRAVSRAHDAGIIHRDLKPDNVFIVRDDEDELVKVLDFGIAKLHASSADRPTDGAARAVAPLGTPYYMSPEQLVGSRALDCRSDVWAVGVMAFECLVGRKPFDAQTIGELALAIASGPMPVPSGWAIVPCGFDIWFWRACSRDLRYRFSSVREAIRELKRVCDEASASSASSSALGTTPGVDPARRAPTVLVARRAPPLKGFATLTPCVVPPHSEALLLVASLVAATFVLAAAATLLWLRMPHRAILPPTITHGSIAADASSRHAAKARLFVTPAVETEEPKAISVESLPMLPLENTRPVLGGGAGRTTLKPRVAAITVVLEETPSKAPPRLPRNRSSLGPRAILSYYGL
jgi:eukaryotic-like serine/threonine-protein kinase